MKSCWLKSYNSAKGHKTQVEVTKYTCPLFLKALYHVYKIWENNTFILNTDVLCITYLPEILRQNIRF